MICLLWVKKHDMNKLPTVKYIVCIFLFFCGGFVSNVLAAQSFCADPIAEKAVLKQFERLALKQMALEFGQEGLELSDSRKYPVGPDLVRVESFLKFRKPGRDDDSLMRIKGWISRCHGTLIIRGNTWLADGTLSVQRFKKSDLAGDGFVFGEPSAPIHVIAFVDSRCPQCHRLIGYMRELVKDGKMYIELRQTAFLEKPHESVQDSQLHLTEKFFKGKNRVSMEDYVEMLGGFASEDDVDRNSENFRNALAMVERNTATARKVLHMTSVPGVLVLDDRANQAYRMTSFWEMNRLFQPDL